MIRIRGVNTRGFKSSESSNARPQLNKHHRLTNYSWKIIFGLEDLDNTGRGTQHVRKIKDILNKSGGQESTGINGGRLLGLEPTIKVIMKQLTNIKRKFTQGKRTTGDVVGARDQQQQQNGQQHRKKVKRPLSKKAPSTNEGQVKNKLNVNERPIRKKKKTKKYESYERNGKSPEPEVKQETNLLLALGLTPVKKEAEDGEISKLNRMHIMEEESTKVTADVAELPQTKPDLPSKAIAALGKPSETAISLESCDSSSGQTSGPLVNGINADAVNAQATWRRNSSEKNDLKKDENGITSVQIPTSIDVTRETDGRMEASDSEKERGKEGESEREKSSEPYDLTVTCTQSFEKTSKTSQNEKHYPNNKVISISVEQCQTTSNSINSVSDEGVDKLKKPKPITNRKRSNKSTDSDESYKTSYKRTKFPDVDHEDRERTVSEYVEKISGSTLEELQMNTEKLQQEIHSLSALARAKELEWNDIIRLKKVKEEIYLRLVRRKQVMLLSMGGSGRMSDPANWDFASDTRMTEFVTNDEVTYNRIAPSVSPKPHRLPSNLTITKSQSSPSQNLQRFLMQPQGASDSKPNTSSLMMVPIVSSTPISISSTSSYLPHLGTSLKIPVPDREKMKVVNNRNAPVPILPKPNQNVNHAINNHSPPIGRQGPIVDVKSIIADYRQNHPEQVPRRGRRPKGQPSQNFAETMMSSGRGVLSMSSLALGSGAQVRTVTSNSESVAGSAGQSHETSRPSSADSNRSTSNAANDVGAATGVSFKDVLVQFAKMSQHQQSGSSDRRNSTPPTKSQSSKAPPYPEVTLHPVLPAGSQSPPNPSSSLLHGILTKNNGGSVSGGGGNGGASTRGESQNGSRSTTFSPTLARLLTTPERTPLSSTVTTSLRGTSTTSSGSRVSSGQVSITDLLSTSKPAKVKEDAGTISDEDPDDTTDRLVIDESEEQEVRNGDDEDVEGDAVPECQGCHMKSAQFVCAGCGNQWYCSRNCQVTAWDEHSEVCSG